jgi:uncharacterized protein
VHADDVRSHGHEAIMYPQERVALESFLARLVQIHGVRKVSEADRMIRQAVSQQPDAVYLLVQRDLLLERALEQARQRIKALENESLRAGADFLERDARASEESPPYSRAMASESVSATGAARSAAPQFSAPTAAPFAAPVPANAGAPSFLGQAAATAAGIAGGAFLFQGVEDMLGHHSALPSHGQGAFPAEDVTVNNYYEGDPTPHNDSLVEAADRDIEDDDGGDSSGDAI